MSDSADGLLLPPPTLNLGTSTSLKLASEVALVAIIVILVVLIVLVAIRRVRMRLRMEQTRALARAGEAEAGLAAAAAASERAPRQGSRRRSLDKATIDSLGLVREFDGDAVPVAPRHADGTPAAAGQDDAEAATRECAVCLSEYKIGEHLRTLNKCGHHFHQECIDAWLSTNPSCPLCRMWLAPHKPLERAHQSLAPQHEGGDMPEGVVIIGISPAYPESLLRAASSRGRHSLQGSQVQVMSVGEVHVTVPAGNAPPPPAHGGGATSDAAGAPVGTRSQDNIPGVPWSFLRLPFLPFQAAPTGPS